MASPVPSLHVFSLLPPDRISAHLVYLDLLISHLPALLQQFAHPNGNGISENRFPGKCLDRGGLCLVFDDAFAESGTENDRDVRPNVEDFDVTRASVFAGYSQAPALRGPDGRLHKVIIDV
jgi:hypothetical protein